MSSTVYYEMSSLDKHVRTPPNHTDTLASTLDHLSNPKYTNLPDLPLLNKKIFCNKAKVWNSAFLLIFSLPLSISDSSRLSFRFLHLPSIYKLFFSVFPRNQQWKACQLQIQVHFLDPKTLPVLSKDTTDPKLWCHNIHNKEINCIFHPPLLF